MLALSLALLLVDFFDFWVWFAADLDDFLGVLGLAVDFDMKIEVFAFLAAGVVVGCNGIWSSSSSSDAWLFASRSTWCKLAEVCGIFSNKSYSGSGSSSLVFLFAAGFFFGAYSSLSVSDRTYSSSPISVWNLSLEVVFLGRPLLGLVPIWIFLASCG